jgi:hypothetical protein
MLRESLEEFIMTWEAAIQRIEQVTGLNLVMLGAAAPPGSQVTTTQMSAASAAHVLKPIIKVIGRMKNSLAETTMRRLQLAFKTRKDMADAYADVVGEADVEILRQAEKDAVQYGLTFEDRPSEEAKSIIMAGATASLQARRDGKPGIDLSQFIYITQQLESGGNLKELAALLDYMMAKSEQAIKEEKEKLVQMQNQGLAQIKQQEGQNAAEAFQREHMGKIQEIDREGQWNMAENGQIPPPGSQGQPQPPPNAPQAPSSGTSPPQGTEVPLAPQSP